MKWPVDIHGIRSPTKRASCGGFTFLLTNFRFFSLGAHLRISLWLPLPDVASQYSTKDLQAYIMCRTRTVATRTTSASPQSRRTVSPQSGRTASTSPQSRRDSPPPKKDGVALGLAGLRGIVTSAQRYHSQQPGSKRKPVPQSPSTLEASSDLSDIEPWDYVRQHIKYFWEQDAGTDLNDRYKRGKQWLTSLRLWDTTLTWKQVETSAPEQWPAYHARKKMSLLAKIPRGCMFVA